MEEMLTEEKKQAWALGKIKSKMVANPPPRSRKPPPCPRTLQLNLRMSQLRQPNPGMEEKNDPQEQVGEGQVEGPKMQTTLLLPGGTGTVPLREEAVPPTIMESLQKVAEPVVGEGESSSGVDEVTVALTRPLQGQLVAVGVEWVAGVAETTAHLLLVATTMSPRAREAVEGMVRIGPSITRPGRGTGVKPAVRVQSMRKSPREGGREVQRLAARVVRVTLVTQTRMTTRNPTPKMALIIPTPLAVVPCHLHPPEVPRPGSSPRGVCPLGGAGVEVVEGETSTGVVAVLEEHLEDIVLDLAQPLTVDPPSPQPRAESSKARHKPLGRRTWAEEEMEERRKTR